MSVVVVGSANVDLVVGVDRLPGAGETVIGDDVATFPGGKGANQAVAAARLGTSTAFVGRVGDDDGGRMLARSLVDAGVDVDALGIDPVATTGTALIAVDRAGRNQIVVSPGANARLIVGDIPTAVATAGVVLVQREVPDAVTEAVAAQATGFSIANPAPADAADVAWLAAFDVIVPNAGELALLSGRPIDDRSPTDAVAAAARAVSDGSVVVTCGARGAVVIAGGEDRGTEVPAPAVDAIDTTAAGDAFCGALAVAIADDADIVSAARFAVRAAALACTRPGAQPSLPTAAEVKS